MTALAVAPAQAGVQAFATATAAPFFQFLSGLIFRLDPGLRRGDDGA